MPGHTPGSAAYLIGPVLFAGDGVAFTRDGAVVDGPWLFNSDGGQAAASRRALAAALAFGGVSAVATSHTAPGKLEDMK
jgi:glyoxylase-like metal-dependent hydrolase (beta-lactamase superfamily II)